MGKKSARSPKKTRTPTELTLRANVQALLAEHYGGKPARFHAVHKKSVTLSRIQDLEREGACNIATLGRVATAFGLKPYQMLIPGLDVKSPQVAVSAKHARALETITGSDHEVDVP